MCKTDESYIPSRGGLHFGTPSTHGFTGPKYPYGTADPGAQ